MQRLIIALLIAGIVIYFIQKYFSNSWKKPRGDFKADWKKILVENVTYYNKLTPQEKNQFEYKVAEFLHNVRIIGVTTQIDDKIRLLVAASAIIPVFTYPKWQYLNLDTVLIYPNSFDHDFDFKDKSGRILGMVGNGYMGGQMVLSKNALLNGFASNSDRRNTALHEFVHLTDKTDGLIDGIPNALTDYAPSLPWTDLIDRKIGEIKDGDSDINPYGATSRVEFLTVASEYYFERPNLLKEKHPELSEYLDKIYKNEIIYRKSNKPKRLDIGRNSPCPCGSGDKFKRCCGAKR